MGSGSMSVNARQHHLKGHEGSEVEGAERNEEVPLVLTAAVISEELKQKILDLASNGDLNNLRRALQPHYTTATSTSASSSPTSTSFHDNDDILLTSVVVDKNSSTTLHYAAGNGHYDVCQYLLSLNSNLLYCKSTNNQRIPLHWSARNGHTDVCKLLLDKDPSIIDTLGKGQVTSLQLCIWQCHLQTARILVDVYNADPTYINSWGCGIAHWLGKCPIYSKEEVVKQEELAKRQQGEEEVVAKREQEREQTHLIQIEQRLVDCCDWLFTTLHNVPYDIRNNYNQTPLHKAAYSGNLPVLKYLVEKLRIIDNVRDLQGNLAYDCALKTQSHDAATYLRRYASIPLYNAIQELFYTTNNEEGKEEFVLEDEDEEVVVAEEEEEEEVVKKDDLSSLPPLPIQIPSVVQIQKRYYQLAKVYHQDRIRATLKRRRRRMANAASSKATTASMIMANDDVNATKQIEQPAVSDDEESHTTESLYEQDEVDHQHQRPQQEDQQQQRREFRQLKEQTEEELIMCYQNSRWNKINTSYKLVLNWWISPDEYNVQIDILSRNSTLKEYLQILWLPEWHHHDHQSRKQRQQHCSNHENNIKRRARNSCGVPATTSGASTKVAGKLDDDIRTFENRLIRLLASPAAEAADDEDEGGEQECGGSSSSSRRRIAMAQLGKEYEKNWHTKLPKPQDYGCRSKKMIQFIQRHCPNIQVKYDSNCKQHAWVCLKSN